MSTFALSVHNFRPRGGIPIQGLNCSSATRYTARVTNFQVSFATFRSIQRRSNSTCRQTRQSAFISHFAAGVAGGATIAISAYAWFHFSGWKATVESVTTQIGSVAAIAGTFTRMFQGNPSADYNESTSYLRRTAKLYFSFVPGSSLFIDAIFDGVNKIHKNYGNEVNLIVSDAAAEMRKVAGSEHSTAKEAWGVLQRMLARLQVVGGTVGRNTLTHVQEQYPEVMSLLNSLGYVVSEGFKQVLLEKSKEAQKTVAACWGQITGQANRPSAHSLDVSPEGLGRTPQTRREEGEAPEVVVASKIAEVVVNESANSRDGGRT